MIATPGTAEGGANSQANALQQGFDAREPFEASTSVVEPFAGGNAEGGEMAGVFFGPGEDDFVRLAVDADGGTPRIELGLETDGAFSTEAMLPLALPASQVRLTLQGRPADDQVVARARIGDGPEQTVGTVQVPPIWFADAGVAGPAAGLMTSGEGSSKDQVAFVFGDFTIERASDAQALMTITHPGRDIDTASTFTEGTMRIENTSAGDLSITGARLDLGAGPAVFPDLVFDPDDGTPAGDTDSKSFTVDPGTSPGVSATGAYSDPNGLGFEVLDLDVSGLDPGDALEFSADIDPTSIQGGPGSLVSGKVSGAELHGATLAITFADGTVRTSDLTLEPGSDTDSRVVLRAGIPVAPILARAGGAPTPATVSQAAQTVVVSGPAGAEGVVLVVEGRLEVDGAPGGGTDLDPFEANTATSFSEVPFTIGAGGTVEVPVALTATPTATATAVGRNHVTAHLVDDGDSGAVSDPLVLELDPRAPTPRRPRSKAAHR